MKKRKRLNAPPVQDQRPDWLNDRRQRVRRLPPFQALEEAGALDKTQRETGDLFALRYAGAVLHAPPTTTTLSAGLGGGEHNEAYQDRARRWVRDARKRAGPAANLIESLALGERPALTPSDVKVLRAGLDEIKRMQEKIPATP